MDEHALKRVLLIHHVWGHHSALGGSGEIGKYIEARVFSASDWPLGNASHGSQAWHIGRRVFDAAILFRCLAGVDLVHFIHAENHPGLLFKALHHLPRGVKTLGTIHLPLDYYSLERSCAAFSHLDGIISLASHQVEEVKQRLPDVRVWHVPCGFDFAHTYGRRNTVPPAHPFNAVVVGSNYRDWSALSEIMHRAGNMFPDWHFHLVGMPAGRKEEYASLSNATVHPRLDDPVYFELLSGAHILLLPLTWATNNTAVLEAYSVGLPTVCTDLPSIQDYAVSTTQTFTTVEEAIRVLERTANLSASEQESLRQTTFQEGKRFDWHNIADQVRGVYAELLET